MGSKTLGSLSEHPTWRLLSRLLAEQESDLLERLRSETDLSERELARIQGRLSVIRFLLREDDLAESLEAFALEEKG